MTGLILRRLLALPLILLVVYTITLTLAWAAPGNPLENPEGRQPPAEVMEAMKRQYNLDSFWRFYLSYLDSASGLEYARDAVTGRLSSERALADESGLAPRARPVFDFGPSLQYEDWTVNEIIAGAMPVSITLGALSILIALLIGIAAGVIGAVKPNSLADLATLAVALVGISLPTFVIGTVLLRVFGV